MLPHVAFGVDSGSGYVFSTMPAPPQIGTNYCGPAQMNTAGLSASIRANGSPVAAANNFSLTAFDMTPMQFGYMLTLAYVGAFLAYQLL